MAKHQALSAVKNYDIVKTMSPADLRTFFERSVASTVEGFTNAATAYAEMKNRGMDLSFIAKDLTVALELISQQGLKPELVINFFGDTGLLKTLAAIVPEDQEKLIPPGAKVPVLFGGQVVNLPPAGMSENQRKQVFGDGRIRTPAEQKPFATPPKPYEPRRPVPAFTLGAAAITPAPVSRAAAAAVPSTKWMDEAAEPEAEWDVRGGLTLRQRKAVIAVATKRGISPAEWIIRLVVAQKEIRS